jgi:glycosyltransferase involved in cell wall biosynthesis
MTPRVSFGLPVFNGQTYIREAIESVLAQDMTDLELVISDNGSTDTTEQICRDAAARDSRVRYHREEINRGGDWNFRRVQELSSAPYFTWIASDDLKSVDFARRCLDVLEDAGPDVVMAYSRTQLIGARGEFLADLQDAHLRLDEPAAHVRVANLLRAQASPIFYGLIRVDALRRTRGFRRCIAPDIVLLTELACVGRLRLADFQGFYQRRHPEQVSAQRSEQMKFYSPNGRARFAFQHSLVNVEILRGIAASDLDLRERTSCLAAAWPNWILPRWRAVAADVRTVVAPRPRAQGTG